MKPQEFTLICYDKDGERTESNFYGYYTEVEKRTKEIFAINGYLRRMDVYDENDRFICHWMR